MENEFRLKVVNLRNSLEQGDITKIAKLAGVSVVSVQKMFKVMDYSELKPAMKLALYAAIDFTEAKKQANDSEIKKILKL